MNSLGQKLKKERELRGVSLDEIASATRIQKKFLEALEDNRFDQIPAPVFITGFLRAYAGHLGMDTDSVVAEYEAMRNTASAEAPIAPRPTAADLAEGKNMPMIAGGVVAAVLVIAVAAYIFRPAAHKAETPAVIEEDLLAPAQVVEPAPSAEPALPAAPQAAISGATTQKLAAPAEELMKNAVAEEAKRSFRMHPEPAKPKEPVAAAPATTVAAVPAKPKPEVKPATPPPSPAPAETKSYPYLLGLSAMAEDVWVYVVVDGQDVRDMYIRSQQTVYLRGAKSFMLTTGNARALRLKLNGKYLPIPGADSNKVIRNWTIPLGGE